MRKTQREIVLLMAREIDPTDAPEDDEYIGEWEPGHTVCGGQGDPGCSGCWMRDYDAREATDCDGTAECESSMHASGCFGVGTCAGCGEAPYGHPDCPSDAPEPTD